MSKSLLFTERKNVDDLMSMDEPGERTEGLRKGYSKLVIKAAILALTSMIVLFVSFLIYLIIV